MIASLIAPKNQNDIRAKHSRINYFLHPANVSKDKRANGVRNKKLSYLLAIERKSTNVNIKDHVHATLRHNDFSNQDLQCVERHCVENKSLTTR